MADSIDLGFWVIVWITWLVLIWIVSFGVLCLLFMFWDVMFDVRLMLYV